MLRTLSPIKKLGTTTKITQYQTPTWWFQGDTKVLNGSNVATWTNKGSGANAITPLGNTSYQPAFSSSVANMNNKPCVTFANTVTGLEVGNAVVLNSSQAFLFILAINTPSHAISTGGATAGWPIHVCFKSANSLVFSQFHDDGSGNWICEIGSHSTTGFGRMQCQTGLASYYTGTQKILLEIAYNGAGGSTTSNYSMRINKTAKTVTTPGGYFNNVNTANSSIGCFLNGSGIPDEQGPGDYGIVLLYSNWAYGLGSAQQSAIATEIASFYNF